MTSKGKKKPSPTPDRSPLPRTPSTPKPGSVSASESEIALLRNLLASRFPTLITNNALVGRISEKDPDLTKGNQESRVCLSESAMLSSSLAPASLVSGCYFAIAVVFPSRKVIKDGVRLSWALSCTLGSPAIGRAVFISPIGNETDKHKCTDIYLTLVPPTDGNSKEHVFVPVVNDTTILSPKTPASRSRLSSPGATPRSGSREPSLDSDVSAVRLALADERARELLQASAARWLYGRYLLQASAARWLYGRYLLQASAARWLYGRYLLVGNNVVVPLVFGQICVFRVEAAEKGNRDLMSEVNSRDQVNVVHVVDARTEVHLSDPLSSVGENPSRERPKKEDTLHMEGRDKEGGDIPRLGGLSKEFDALKEIIMFSLANKDHLPRYRGVLLHGPPGTGKTSLASYCARDAGASLFYINGPEIVSQYFGESEQALYEVFDSAKRAAPAVIFIDELDAIAPTRNDGGEELSLRMVATLLKLMDEINRSDGILVIAATNRPDSIDPAMRRPGRLDREIEIGVPSPEQRLHILSTLLSRMDHSISAMELQSLASATHGFVGADLAALCNEAAMIALRRHIKFTSSTNHFEDPSFKDGSDADSQSCKHHANTVPRCRDHISSLLLSLSELTVSTKYVCPINHQKASEGDDTSQDVPNRTNKQEEMLLKVTIEDFEKAKMKVRPSAMREVMLELPKVQWEDVGGQNKVKQQLIEAVQWPQMCPEAFERIGIRPPRGLLLIGPPGCSKTLMARAVASEAKLNFLAVKGPELFSKWVGESEKAIRSLFAKARANSPAIIFFDEIDGLAITRGEENDGTSVSDRVLSQLLVEMDGLDRRAAVTVIAATNRPDKIDPALLRPGRFDRLLDVQPPDKTDREAIFHIHVRNIPCRADVSIKDLACLTEGYTGADIKLICREAAVAALEESLEITEVSMEHFKIGIARVHPSDVQFYKELAVQFRRIVDSGVR